MFISGSYYLLHFFGYIRAIRTTQFRQPNQMLNAIVGYILAILTI
jgi:hypothetical protein